jgi:hypothetical protein
MTRPGVDGDEAHGFFARLKSCAARKIKPPGIEDRPRVFSVPRA